MEFLFLSFLTPQEADLIDSKMETKSMFCVFDLALQMRGGTVEVFFLVFVFVFLCDQLQLILEVGVQFLNFLDKV